MALSPVVEQRPEETDFRLAVGRSHVVNSVLPIKVALIEQRTKFANEKRHLSNAVPVSMEA